MPIRQSALALTTALCVASAAPASSQSFEAINLLRVVPLTPTSFEVIEARGEGASGMWCAAADFTIHRLGVQGNPRLYVKTPRGPSVSGAGRIGAVFTTDAGSLAVAPQQSYSVSVRVAGLGLPTQHAYQFCRADIFEPDDILFRRLGN